MPVSTINIQVTYANTVKPRYDSGRSHQKEKKKGSN